MSNQIQQLGNNESVLLMYLTDELSGEDRAEVTAMLQTDASLRGELEHLRSTYVAVMGGLERLDAVTAFPMDESEAVRRAAGAIRQWQARPIPAYASTASAPRLHPWRLWALPAAAAAAVLVSVGISLHTFRHVGQTAINSPHPTTPGHSSSSGDDLPNVVIPPAVPPGDDVAAGLLVMDTRLPELVALDDPIGTGVEPVRDDHDSTAVHDDAGSTGYSGPVFDIPLDAGQ